MTAPEFYTTASGHRAYGVPGPGEAAQQAAAALTIANVLADMRDAPAGTPMRALYDLRVAPAFTSLDELLQQFRPQALPEAEPGFWDTPDIRARMM